MLTLEEKQAIVYIKNKLDSIAKSNEEIVELLRYIKHKL
jgi:hypothetical protein